jgi:long-chain acyl-CoA synthetase
MALTRTKGPTPIDVGPHDHLPARLDQLAVDEPDLPVVAVPEDSGWTELTRRELAERVHALAAGLVERGVEPGDRVALISPTRLEWTLADLAILASGGVTVPLYDTSSDEQCQDIMSDSGARFGFAATSELADRIGEAATDGVIVFDDGGIDELIEGADDASRQEVAERTERIQLDETATIVYTSGTTGEPKGCVLTHRNLAWTTVQTSAHLDDVVGSGGSLLQFLPLAHIFARLIQFVCLDAGLKVGYASSLDDLRDDLQTFQPTLVLGVPRVFEKFFDTARGQATGVRRPLFDFAVETGRQWAAADRPGPWSTVKHRVADVLVYRRLRAALGGQVDHCVSGGAPLSRDLALFFHSAGLPVLEGYGLTETTAPAAVNTPTHLRYGTVGRPLPGVEIRLADDGEVMIRGGNVFAGYHGDRGDAEDDFDGDWFLTGDLGDIDDDGYLSLRDRKKDLVVTASGKNVAPTPLEERMTSFDLIAQAMVVGDKERFVAALVALDEDKLAEVTERAGDDTDDPRQHKAVRDEVQRAVDHANALVSRAESIREFAIVDRQFDADHEELTPTMKLRRSVIAEHFADDIDSIYR